MLNSQDHKAVFSLKQEVLPTGPRDSVSKKRQKATSLPHRHLPGPRLVLGPPGAPPGALAVCAAR